MDEQYNILLEHNQKQDKAILDNLNVLQQHAQSIEDLKRIITDLKQSLDAYGAEVNEVVSTSKNQYVMISELSEQNKKLEEAVSSVSVSEQSGSGVSDEHLEQLVNEQGKRIVKNAEKMQGVEKSIDELTKKGNNLEALVNALSEREKKYERVSGGDNGALEDKINEQAKLIEALVQKNGELEQSIRDLHSNSSAAPVADTSKLERIISEQAGAIDVLSKKSAELENKLSSLPSGEGAAPASVDTSAIDAKINEQNNVINQLAQRNSSIEAVLRAVTEKEQTYDQLLAGVTSGEGGAIASVGQDKLVSDLTAKGRKHDELFSEINEKQNMYYKLLEDFRGEVSGFDSRINESMQQIAALRAQVSNNRLLRSSQTKSDKPFNWAMLFAIVALGIAVYSLVMTQPDTSNVKAVTQPTTVSQNAEAEGQG